MVHMNSTTVWEHWEYMNGDGMNSHNHPALASVGSWFFRWVAGIRLGDENSKNLYGRGFRQFLVAPDVTLNPAVVHVNTSVGTLYGPITVEWTTDVTDRSFTITVGVPIGTTATLWLPPWIHAVSADVFEGPARSPVWAKNRTVVPGVPGIPAIFQGSNDRLWLELLSGDFAIRAEAKHVPATP